MQNIKRIKIQTDRWMPVYIAILLMIVPIKLLLCIALSILVHELFHLIAIIIMGIPVYGIKICVFGARIISSPMDNSRELICSIAGPLGGMFLALVCYKMTLIHLCAVFHTIYNLLPLYPLDGGRILRCILLAIIPGRMSDKISIIISRFIKTAFIFLIGVYLIEQNLLYYLPCLILAVIKIPCKHANEGVQ